MIDPENLELPFREAPDDGLEEFLDYLAELAGENN